MVESEQWGPVIVTGDFNGHLGPTWGSRAHKNSNILLGEVLDRCKLHAVSLGEAISGPDYTYHSGKSSTTVDYILADVEASSCVESCDVLEDTDLNMSDHLPIYVTLSCDISTQFSKDSNWIRIDWAKAGKSDAVLTFQREVSNRLKPYIKRSRGNVDHIGQEIRHVAWLVNDAAQKTLPLLKPRWANRFRDKTLSQLCIRSKEAWRAWCREGRPVSRPAYDAKCALRRKFCSAMEERKRVQWQESLFRSNSHLCFRTPQSRSKSKCTRLRVNGTLLSDPSLLLQAWTQHFQSPRGNNPALKQSIEQSKTLLSTPSRRRRSF